MTEDLHSNAEKNNNNDNEKKKGIFFSFSLMKRFQCAGDLSSSAGLTGLSLLFLFSNKRNSSNSIKNIERSAKRQRTKLDKKPAVFFFGLELDSAQDGGLFFFLSVFIKALLLH